MKLGIVVTFLVGVLIFFISMPVMAQTPNQVVISKDATGIITQVSLSLSLLSSDRCDESQSIIPNNSKLFSDSFVMNINSKGMGTFLGEAKIVSPAGEIILSGRLEGTVGFTAKGKQAKRCRTPGHLEGMFIVPSTNSTNQTPILMANFSADEIAESASPVPKYRAHLDGLMMMAMSPPQTDKITIVPDRQEYDVNQVITATITNKADQAIQVFDEESYCGIIQLQRQEGSNWILQAGCPLDRAPMAVTIVSGETKQILLPPNSQFPIKKEVGTYRLALTFFLLDQIGKPTGNPLTITSSSFSVDTSTNSVKLTTDRSSYSSDSTIIATIKNDTSQDIQTEDHRSYCTILWLQYQTGSGWQNVSTCPLLSPTRLVTIKAKESVSIVLPPNSNNVSNPPGSYRVELVFIFLDSNGNPTGQPIVLDSTPFNVATTPKGNP